MSNEKTKPTTANETTEEAEEYLVKYNAGPTTSTTQQGNIYNVNVFIGQPSPPPYVPKP